MKSKLEIDELYREFESEDTITPEKRLYYGRKALEYGLAPNGIDSKGYLIQPKFDVDPEIRNIIKFVNDNGMKTYASCQGHSIYEEFGGSYGYISYHYPFRFRFTGIDKSSNVARLEAIIIDSLAKMTSSNQREFIKQANSIYEMTDSRRGAMIHLPWSIDGSDSIQRRKELWGKVYKDLIMKF